MKNIAIGLAVFLCFVVSPVAAQEPILPQAGQTCIACHGEDGNSSTDVWPKLAGQHADYLYQQMKAFQAGKDGPRYNASMLGMVANLSDGTLQQLANYYAEQTISVGYADEDKLELGQKIYRAGISEVGIPACMACHGPRGLGNAQAGYPRVSNQHAAYTAQQLQHYRDGIRKGVKHGIMADIASRMRDEEMIAVASYIEGLH